MSESKRVANVVVALRERKTGRVWPGEPGEQHPDVRRRCQLGARTAGWLTDGFIDLDTGEFLTRGQAARRWPEEAGRTHGRGTADSSDFEAIRRAKLARTGSGGGRVSAGEGVRTRGGRAPSSRRDRPGGAEGDGCVIDKKQGGDLIYDEGLKPMTGEDYTEALDESTVFSVGVPVVEEGEDPVTLPIVIAATGMAAGGGGERVRVSIFISKHDVLDLVFAIQLAAKRTWGIEG